MNAILRQVYCQSQGVVAPLGAIIMAAILLVAMLAMDISRVTGASHKAKLVADSAALHAVAMVRSQIEQGLEDELDPMAIEQLAIDAFTEQIRFHNLKLNELAVDLNIEGDDYNLDIDYEVELTKMLTDEPIVISDSTSATTNYTAASTYMDIHLLVDVSGSMSTGATLTDQADLWKIHGCAFACHAINVNEARSRRIALRIDKLVQALRELAATAEEAVLNQGLAEDSSQFNIWKFNTGVSSGGTTTDLQNFRTDVDAINNSVPSGHTNISGALDWLRRNRLPASGDGFTPETRRTFVFLITDGIADQGARLNITGNRGNVDPEYCETIKATGATMAVIYTKYEDYSDSYYEAWGSGASGLGGWGSFTHSRWVSHYNTYARTPVANMTDVMESCASEDFYFETSNPTQLNDALQELYQNAIEKTKGAPRLSS